MYIDLIVSSIDTSSPALISSVAAVVFAVCCHIEPDMKMCSQTTHSYIVSGKKSETIPKSTILLKWLIVAVTAVCFVLSFLSACGACLCMQVVLNSLVTGTVPALPAIKQIAVACIIVFGYCSM